MFYDNKIWIGLSGDEKVSIVPKMANRHGLIAGATGTGKTITLKVLAESFSDAGIPVFLADVKGDLSGMCRKGEDSESMQKRIERFGLAECGFRYDIYPTEFWDIYQTMGIPLRTTISEMGPLLLSKLLELNNTQTDILNVVFKIADDQNLLLIDTKDLRAMLSYVAENCRELSYEYGNISKQSVTTILRHVISLEAQGGDIFFNQPALNLNDWITTDRDGRGTIHVLDSRELINNGFLYSAFLLWLLAELFETLPEVGDAEKPKMIFFFDEAHLLFDGISKALEDKIEQVVKLIRSKGVGIYFITQNPSDIPNGVLGQLGNKIQHALHAYTPADEKAVKTAANSFRKNPEFDTAEEITKLGIGEALISVLDEFGTPGIVKKCKVLPPQSLMGMIPDEDRKQEALLSRLYYKYKDVVDPESAYEILTADAQQKEQERKEAEEAKLAEKKAAEEAKQAEREAKAKAAEEAKAEKAAAAAAEKEAKAQAAAEAKAEKEAAAAAEKEAKAKAAEEAKKTAAAKKAAKSVASSATGTIGREVGKTIGNSIGGKFGKTIGGNVGAALGRGILGTFFRS